MTHQTQADEAKALEQKKYNLTVCWWEGVIRCVYLNNHRIAGEKPWGGGQIAREFTGITLDELARAIPEISDLLTQLTEAQEKLAEADTHLSAWFEKFKDTDDRGPLGEGWQSDDFCALIETTEQFLSTRQPTQDKGE